MKIKFVLTIIWGHLLGLNAEVPIKGIVKPIHDIQISSPVEGSIRNIPKKEGSLLKSGDVLLIIDDQLPKLEFQRRKLIQEDQSQLNALKKNMDVLSELVSNKETLFENTKAISASELNRFKMQLTKAQADLKTTEANEKRELVDLEIAEVTLELFTIKTPINGSLVEYYLDVGEWVKIGDPLVRVVDHSICFVEIDVEINQIKNLKEGLEVDLKIPTPTGDFMTSGNVVFISEIADSGSGMVRAKLYLNNKENKVLPGVTAEVYLK